MSNQCANKEKLRRAGPAKSPTGPMLLRACLLLALPLLAACVSYEPRVLVPELTMSAEDLLLENARPDESSGVDFGMELGVNESDSLFNVEVLPGVRVRNVTPNGAAAAAGIQAADVILRIADLETNDPDTVASLASRTTSVEQFTVTLRRGTAVLETTVTPQLRAQATAMRELHRIDPLASKASYRTDVLETASGQSIAVARVIDVPAASPLAEANINEGDLILSVNNIAVQSAQQLIGLFNQRFELGQRLSLSVYADGEISTREITLWDPGRRISRISLGPLMQYESSLEPAANRFSILDLWLFSLYSYNQQEGERSHSILGLLNFSSDYGELIEE